MRATAASSTPTCSACPRATTARVGGEELLVLKSARVLGFEARLVTSPSYEYGNTFTAVAGLLNILVILDALDTARGVRGK